MSLSEIQAAGAAATTGGGITSGHEDADKNYSQKGEGLDETPASVDPSDRESEEWPPAGQSVECDRIVDPGGKDWEGEEGDGGGAGGRARQRLKSGGRRMRAGQGREPDLSVRYLIAKVKAFPFVFCLVQSRHACASRTYTDLKHTELIQYLRPCFEVRQLKRVSA